MYCKCLAITLITFLYISIGRGQQNKAEIEKKDTPCIILDAKKCCGNLKLIPEYLREGSRIMIKIKNVNPFYTKLQAFPKIDTVDFEANDVFKLSFGKSAPNIDNQNKNNFNELLTNLKFDFTSDCYKDFKKGLDSFHQLIRLINTIQTVIKQPVISKDDLNKQIEWLMKCYGFTEDTCCCFYESTYERLIQLIKTNYECINNKVASTNPKDRNATLSGTMINSKTKEKWQIKNASIIMEEDKSQSNPINSIDSLYNEAC
jgi:hypothetical protein